MSGIKRTAEDVVFSDLVRLRANFTCERCGIEDPQGQATGKSSAIDCSHVYGRRHRSTRWHPDNAFALCKSCHSYLEDRPIEHAQFAREKLGDTRHDMLIETHHRPVKFTKADKKAMREHYRQELNRIRDERSNGNMGYIEFTAFL